MAIESELLFSMLRDAVTCVSVGAMIFGGVVPFIPQYIKIRRSRDPEGFSTYVCLVLLVAYILRVCFWFGVHYEWPLLAQSMLMIVTMLLMIHLCVRVRWKENDTPQRIWDINPRFFWLWSHFLDYLIFLFLLTLTIGTITLCLIRVKPFVELLGFASLLTEASLGVPQFLRNLKHRSTQGMSVAMVFMWLSGDIFKTIYFTVRHSPMQFSICGSLQVLVDIAILFQVAVYQHQVS